MLEKEMPQNARKDTNETLHILPWKSLPLIEGERTEIFLPGNPVDSKLFRVKEGLVMFKVFPIEKPPVIAYVAKAGEVFGYEDMKFVGGNDRRTFGAITSPECKLEVVTLDEELLNPSLKIALAFKMKERINTLIDNWEIATLGEVKHKVPFAILDFLVDGKVVGTQTELAERVGSKRQRVNLEVNELVRQQLITKNRGIFYVSNPELLRQKISEM